MWEVCPSDVCGDEEVKEVWGDGDQTSFYSNLQSEFSLKFSILPWKYVWTIMPLPMRMMEIIEENFHIDMSSTFFTTQIASSSSSAGFFVTCPAEWNLIKSHKFIVLIWNHLNKYYSLSPSNYNILICFWS